MRMGFLSALLLPLVAVSPWVVAAEKPAKHLEEKGTFSIATPDAGFEWSKLGEADGKPRAVSYQAKKAGVEGEVVMLTVQYATADKDATRVAAAKAHYNGLVRTLQQQKFADVEGTKPPLQPPMPDRFAFFLTGKNAHGASVTFHSVTVFGKKATYLVQSVAATPERAQALAKVAETIKE